jgi:hypothetical protein
MITNQDAYSRIQAAAVNAAAAYAHATTHAAQDKLSRIYLAYDAEMDEMIARGLKQNSGKYTPLTTDLKAVKAEIDQVVNNTQQFVEVAALVGKIASTFAGVLALL